MLDKYLEVAFQEQEKTASRDRFVELMMKLPDAELHEMAKTGHIKVGYFDSGEILGKSDEGSSWLDHFKGTPLHPQAVALLEEELKMQAADDQQSLVQDQERSQKSQARDQIRLQKRLLELELVKQESAAESAAMPPPPPSPGMGAPPGMGAQGAGAPGDMAPEGAGDGTPGKFGSIDEMAAAMRKSAGGVGDFLRAAAPAVGQFVKSHPGAAIGGGLGALHGLLHQGGGVGSAVLEGAGGAALGHAGQHLYEGGLGDKLRGAMGKVPPEPATATVAKEASVEGKKEKEEPLSHRAGRFLGRHSDDIAGMVGGAGGAHHLHKAMKGQGYGPKGRLAGAAVGAVIGHRVGRAAGRFEQGVISGEAHAHPSEKKKEAAVGYLPFVGEEKEASPSLDRVRRALRGVSKNRVEDFTRTSSRRSSRHMSDADSAIRNMSKWDDQSSVRRQAERSHRNALKSRLHVEAAGHEIGRRAGRSEGHLEAGAVGVAAGGAGYLAGKHRGEKEKRAFGAFLGAIGGALAGAGARGLASGAASGALGAGAKGLMSGGLKGLAGGAVNWAKSNPMKAVGGAVNAASNFASARQQGEGLGGAALSGLAGGATALG
jgi:hypothetical protein